MMIDTKRLRVQAERIKATGHPHVMVPVDDALLLCDIADAAQEVADLHAPAEAAEPTRRELAAMPSEERRPHIERQVDRQLAAEAAECFDCEGTGRPSDSVDEVVGDIDRCQTCGGKGVVPAEAAESATCDCDFPSLSHNSAGGLGCAECQRPIVTAPERSEPAIFKDPEQRQQVADAAAGEPQAEEHIHVYPKPPSGRWTIDGSDWDGEFFDIVAPDGKKTTAAGLTSEDAVLMVDFLNAAEKMSEPPVEEQDELTKGLTLAPGVYKEETEEARARASKFRQFMRPPKGEAERSEPQPASPDASPSDSPASEWGLPEALADMERRDPQMHDVVSNALQEANARAEVARSMLADAEGDLLLSRERERGLREALTKEVAEMRALGDSDASIAADNIEAVMADFAAQPAQEEE